MSVKKIKQSRKGNKDARNAPRVRTCACITHYGMKHCVAQYDAEKDMHWYKGIPCEYCGGKMNRWEDEYMSCDECNAAEARASEQNIWYAETIYNWGNPMHQEITEYRNWEQELDELLGTPQ